MSHSPDTRHLKAHRSSDQRRAGVMTVRTENTTHTEGLVS